MKKTQEPVEKVESTEEKKPFFFSKHDRTIMAHSLSEAQRLLSLELNPEETQETK